MTRYETTVVLCRKSDRQLIQVHINEPVDAIREKYVKAAVDMMTVTLERAIELTEKSKHEDLD